MVRQRIVDDDLEEHREEIKARLTAIETTGPSIMQRLDAALSTATSVAGVIEALDAKRAEAASASAVWREKRDGPGADFAWEVNLADNRDEASVRLAQVGDDLGRLGRRWLRRFAPLVAAGREGGALGEWHPGTAGDGAPGVARAGAGV